MIVSMHGKNPSGILPLYQFHAGAQRKILSIGICEKKRELKLLVGREVSFNQVQTKLAFFKGTL